MGSRDSVSVTGIAEPEQVDAGVHPFDLPTYLVACVALLSAAVLASYIPSCRALSVDPAEALLAE